MEAKLKVKVGNCWYTVEVGDLTKHPVSVLVDGELVEVNLENLTEEGMTKVDTGREETKELDNSPQPRVPTAPKVFKSPMAGVIVSVAVKEGDQIVTGDDVCVLEAMKMQQSLKADWSGIVGKVHVREGQQMLDGEPIMELK